MSEVRIPNTFATPSLPPESRVHDVLQSTLRARGFLSRSIMGMQGLSSTLDGPVYWGADHFRLSEVCLFADAAPEKRRNILSLLSVQTLEEACLIEKSGMCFTAKMSLLAETTEERMLYSLFASDETIHLQQILSYLPESPSLTGDRPFLSMLSEMIQTGERESLVLLIQVILEGWGITHYHALAETTLCPELKGTLRMILKDEARHHGSGMLLCKGNALPASQKNFLTETLVEFLKMVACGPQGVIQAFEETLGHLSVQQKTKLHEELGSQSVSAGKLNLLRQLLEQGGASSLVETLDKYGAWYPLTAAECAKF